MNGPDSCLCDAGGASWLTEATVQPMNGCYIGRRYASAQGEVLSPAFYVVILVPGNGSLVPCGRSDGHKARGYGFFG